MSKDQKQRLAPPPDETASDATKAFVVSRGQDYDPDKEAYARTIGGPTDLLGAEKPSPVYEFAQSARSGKAMLEVWRPSGRCVKLDESQTKEYVESASVADREKVVLREGRKQTLDVAKNIIEKLRKTGSLDKLHPNEEALLREVGALKKVGEKEVLREDFASDDFGYPPGQGTTSSNMFFPDYLITGQGPMGQQLYLSDQFDMLAKSWYCWHHDPIGHQLIQIVVYFVLGRGLQIICQDEKTQKFVDEFWTREQMDERLKTMAQDLGRDGELFIRLLRNPKGSTRIRLMDPGTIWEIVTDAEDIELVSYYRQMWQTRTQLYAPKDGGPSQKYIVRDLEPNEIIHVKVNCGANEVRGRSDLFPVLGYLKRLRDYMTAEILKAFAAAMIQFDYEIKGGPNDVARIQNNTSPPTMATTGNAFFHNDAVKVTVVQADKVQPTSSGSIYEGLINMGAVGGGVAKDYLGITSRGSRGTQLLAAEPATKRFEERQQVIKGMVTRVISEVLSWGVKTKALETENLKFRVDMPAISAADKDMVVKLMAIGEAMDWWSKRVSAERAAAEVGLPEYDFKSSQEEIKTARTQRPEVIWSAYQQVPKGIPDPTEMVIPGGDAINPDYTGPRDTAPDATKSKDFAQTPALGDRSATAAASNVHSTAGQKTAHNALGKESLHESGIRIELIA